MKLTATFIISWLINTALFSQIPRDNLDLWLKSDTGVLVTNNQVRGWMD